MKKKFALFEAVTTAIYKIQHPLLNSLPAWLPNRIGRTIESLLHPFSSLFCWKIEHKIHLYDVARARAIRVRASELQALTFAAHIEPPEALGEHVGFE